MSAHRTHSEEEGWLKKRRMEASHQFIRTWGMKGCGHGQFQQPHGLVTTEDGVVYVADSGNHRIQCFDADGVFKFMWGSRGTLDGEFDFPFGLAVHVHDSMKKQLVNALSDIPELYAWPPGVLPICIAYVGEENIYVVDNQNHRIQVFKQNGGFMRKWGITGIEDGELYHPSGCAVATDGTVFVTDTHNHRIQAFDSHGVFIRLLEDKEFTTPAGIAIGKDGLIYVSDMDKHRIFCFRMDDKRFVGTHVCAADYPAGVTVHPNGRVYVVGHENHLIHVFQQDGTLITTFGGKGMSDGCFWHPWGICTGSSNNMIYVADTWNDRISVFNVV
jgi:tripartite motif-containing protein 71